jgi:hypothetical protein
VSIYKVDSLESIDDKGHRTKPLRSNLGLKSNMVDWTGFRCPICNTAERAGSQFVQCGRCGQLVCASKVIAIKGGDVTFECHKYCGNSDVLSQSNIIQKYDAKEKQEQIEDQGPPRIMRSASSNLLQGPDED